MILKDFHFHFKLKVISLIVKYKVENKTSPFAMLQTYKCYCCWRKLTMKKRCSRENLLNYFLPHTCKFHYFIQYSFVSWSFEKMNFFIIFKVLLFNFVASKENVETSSKYQKLIRNILLHCSLKSLPLMNTEHSF